MRKLLIGEKVKVIRDETEEFLNCVGMVSIFEEASGYENELSIGVAFGKADNTVPLGNGKWGAWFDRSELSKTKKDTSPICPTPVD